jgi:D-cysteine desulfhydrase
MQSPTPESSGPQDRRRSLFQRFPDLERKLPHFPICQLPTPVERAATLERSASTGPLYVKRDDATAPLYGGNKARKLEWLLARARASGRTRVMTFGALGTNHGFATALYAARAGLRCDLVLADQPVDEKVRRRLRQLKAAGAEIHYGGSVAGAALRTLGLLARHPRASIIATGGSSPVGVLGFVDAGLELAEQVQRGELPEPECAYIALGTGGSVAGLAVGMAIAGLGTRVVGVLVTDRGLLEPSPARLERLARRTAALLARSGAPLQAGRLQFHMEIEPGYRGDGYGHPTEAGAAAVRLAAEQAGLRLETTYTGKALAALLGRESGRGAPVLFWNTYAGAEPELELPDWRTLPRAFQRFFGEAA